MIDSHVHLDHPAFEEDLEEVIAHAVEDGVRALVNVGYDPKSARATAAFLDKYPFFYGVVGTHPHDASGHDQRFEADLEKLLGRSRVVGVGEIGLDYYYDYSPRDVQKDVFRRMLHLARRVDKPVVLHCRDAGDDVLDILASDGAGCRGIFHAFSGDAGMARTVLDLGYHLGVGGVVTFKNSRLLESIRDVPLDRIVLETDCPYLAPHPFRGRRNEPALVRFVAEALGLVHGLTPGDVIRITSKNFYSIFGIDEKTLPPPVYKVGRTVYIQTIPGVEAERVAAAADAAAEAPGEVTGAVICGYEDPLEHLDLVDTVALRFKRRGIPVRLLAGVAGRAVTDNNAIGVLAGAVDSVAVRFYGGDAAQHKKALSVSEGDRSFEALVEFARSAAAAAIPLECQFVAGPKAKLQTYRALAGKLGAGFSVRKYRSL